MDIYFSLTMFLCVVVTALIMFALIYPRNWREKKLILGLKNRDEFREGSAEQTVDRIVKKRRLQAGVTVICICAIAVFLFLMRKITLLTTVWVAFLFIALILLILPYILGNRDLKAVKRMLGLGKEVGVSYVDLSSAGAIHALKPMRIWIPTLLGLVPVVIALLTDLKILSPGKSTNAGMFIMTSVTGIGWLVGVLMLVFAYVFDDLKNEVISKDSDVNANYNRAKKKNFADMFVMFSWINTAVIICSLAAMLFVLPDTGLIVGAIVYLIAMFACVALFVRRSKMIDARYEKEMTLLADDDDHWILGLFYYNPNDSRLTVEKRVGVGATVNAGHPVGKVIMGLCGLVLIGVIAMLVWLGLGEATPMKLSAKDGTVVCHHLKDDYVIKIADIQSVEYGEGIDELRLVRNVGTGTATMQKGNFSVKGENGCKVFLWVESGNYIKIVTAEDTYYINGGTPEETKEVYEAIVGK